MRNKAVEIFLFMETLPISSLKLFVAYRKQA